LLADHGVSFYEHELPLIGHEFFINICGICDICVTEKGAFGGLDPLKIYVLLKGGLQSWGRPLGG
jgi:hypothetical protein